MSTFVSRGAGNDHKDEIALDVIYCLGSDLQGEIERPADYTSRISIDLIIGGPVPYSRDEMLHFNLSSESVRRTLLC